MSEAVGRSRLAGALLLVLALGAAVLVARSLHDRGHALRALPPRDGLLRVAGLTAPLEIVRDRRGVPHVLAESERDALFGLGFAHAQDRLAQLEWLRRSAHGRAAEIVGPVALPQDRLARALGFAHHAEHQVGRLDAPTRRALEAYAAGVNAWIAHIHAGRAVAPRDLQRLGVPLDDWTPADSIAVVKAFAWALSGSLDATLVLSDLVDVLGGFGARPFFPPGAAAELVPIPPRRPVQARAPRAPLRHALGLAGSAVGSSAWVVSGRLTASGRPIVAGDLHVGPRAPSLFYPAHWRAGEEDVAGVTIPGVPVFWSGHNRHVAWAATEARLSVLDVYRETLDPADPRRVQTGRGWRAVELRSETLRVAGADPEEIEIRVTAHGPIAPPAATGDGAALAVGWPGARSGDGVGALLRAARARSADEFRSALARHHEPVFVFVYADAAGRGGRQVAGFVPARALPSGLLPVAGRTRWHDWRGAIPFEDLPHTELAEETDWLIAADNPLAESAGEVPLEWWWRPGERARRIDALLRAARANGPVDAQVLAAVQHDEVAAGAVQRARLVLELAGDRASLPPGARAVAELLEDWNGVASETSRGAAAWHVLMREIVERSLADAVPAPLLERFLGLRGAGPEWVLDLLLEIALAARPDADASVEPGAVRAAVRAGLRQAALSLQVRLGPERDRWHWGRLHRVSFTPFGWLGRGTLPDALATSHPLGGDGSTVAVAEYDPAEPFDVRVVSGHRWVVDLASPGLSLAAFAPGVSEHPSDPLASAALEPWLAGRATLLGTHPLVVDEAARSRLVLEPEP